MSQYQNLRRILSEYYNLGELISLNQITKGYINISYKIETHFNNEKFTYLLRLYGKDRSKNQIEFEHALLSKLRERNFFLAPEVVKTVYDDTYVKTIEQPSNLESYIAVFTFLPGEDKYQWDNPSWTDQELANAAKVLALYHNSIYGWQGGEIHLEPRVVDKIPAMLNKWKMYVASQARSHFDSYFSEHLDYLDNLSIKLLSGLPAHSLDNLPEIAIHGDYHPGNLLFQDGNVTGVLDFDWAKMDVRCFDTSLAVLYFCTAWQGTTDGNLILERVDTFLASYLQAGLNTSGPGPLTSHELNSTPAMILASAFFLVDWIVDDYYTIDPDPEESLHYLQHTVRLIKWLECNWNELERCVFSYHP